MADLPDVQINKSVKITYNGRCFSAISGLPLSEIIEGEKPCSGQKKCGKCKVIVSGAVSETSVEEIQLLTKKELENGVRLSCCTYALGDVEVRPLLYKGADNIVVDGVVPEFKLDLSFKRFGVAVDIGTTTIAAKLYDTSAKSLATVSRINPQTRWGADVISRITESINGNGRNQVDAIRRELDDIIGELASLSGIDPTLIDDIVVTGNTVMLSILTNESLVPFSRAPFEIKRFFGESLTAREVGLLNVRPETSVYLPPCISAFVGADIVCSIIATELYTSNNAILVDLGTNGEMAMRHNGRMIACSTAAGPAFEGAGISKGMRGQTGAIDKVCISDGAMQSHVIGDTDPIGICGSGLVDAVSCMLKLGILEESGYLEKSTEITPSVSIEPKDIRALQLAKSAICAGIMTLIEREDLAPSDINILYVAGGFGAYLNTENAVQIGLIPKELESKMRAVGNAALVGAAMLLLNAKLRERVKNIMCDTEVIDLSINKTFADNYIACMSFEEIQYENTLRG